jgi:hypothetical protein
MDVNALEILRFGFIFDGDVPSYIWRLSKLGMSAIFAILLLVTVA